MKCRKEKKLIFIFVLILIAVFIFSTAALCNLCTVSPQGRGNDTIPEEVISAISLQQADETSKEQVRPESGTDQNYEAQDRSSAKDQSESQSQIQSNSKDSNSYPADSAAPVREDISPGAKKIILKDNRLVISIDSMADRGTEWSYQNGNDPSFNETIDYFTKTGIPKQQLLFFWGQDGLGATFNNFKLAVDTLKISSDKNSIVYVFLMSHGNEGDTQTGREAIMEFSDGQGSQHWGAIKTYSEICSMLNGIECEKMVVITHSCAIADSVLPLTQNTSYPRISMAPITIQEILNYIMTDGSMVDMDGDTRISILDIYNFIKDPEMTNNPARYEPVKLSDYFGIASNIFIN